MLLRSLGRTGGRLRPGEFNAPDPDEGFCAMSAIAWLVHGTRSDAPECACPGITAFVITGNDAMPDNKRQRFLPLLHRIAGSRSEAHEMARARILTMAALREFAPMALDGVGLHHLAQTLRALPDDVDMAVAEEVAWRASHWRQEDDSITVAMDWTEFDADGQATIMLSLLSRHGRATPLVWLTVDKAALKNRRNGYEYQVLVRLAEILPADVRVRVVADRGFGDHKLYRVLTEELKFDFVIRFRGNIAVTATSGEARAAADWVGAGGRARTLRGAAVTAEAYPVATVVCVRAKGMKEPWCLAASTADEPARTSLQWLIEPSGGGPMRAWDAAASAQRAAEFFDGSTAGA